MALVERLGNELVWDSIGWMQAFFGTRSILHYDYNGDGFDDRLEVADNGDINYFQNNGAGNYTQRV